MYKRVVVPALLATGVPVAAALYDGVLAFWQRHTIDAILAKHGELQNMWLPPALPTNWLLFLAIFLAVRMCVLRGGSRRDALLVALSPALITGIGYAAVGIEAARTSWPLLALGDMRPVLMGNVTTGTAMMVHGYVGSWLGLLATALSALWLYFFVARQPLKLPVAAAATSPDATASAQTPA